MFLSQIQLRWREGNFNELVFIKGDGNALPVNPEDIIPLVKRKYVIEPLLTNNLIYRIGNTNTPHPKYGLKK